MSTKPNTLEVKNISKYFEMPAGAKNLVLENVNFSISNSPDKGQIVSILAPFGSGKSTLLKIIGGIEKPSIGDVLFNNVLYKPELKKIVYIPENASSFPWLNVKQNLMFAIDSKGKNYVEKNIANVLSLVGLSGYENHFPDHNSYGFRFRISLARALIINPVFILIDDVFKNLDHETKNEIYSTVKFICKELKIFFILATADISESIKLSSSIFLMKKNPGSIFHELKLPHIDYMSDQFKVNREVILIRDEITSLFNSKNVLNEVSFSI